MEIQSFCIMVEVYTREVIMRTHSITPSFVRQAYLLGMYLL